MTEYCVVTTTIDSADAADGLARTAVTARLAACAQVTGPVNSIYWWQGQLEEAEEWTVAFKTTTAAYPTLEQHLREQHAYDVPEILCTPVIDGSAAYLSWIREQTQA